MKSMILKGCTALFFLSIPYVLSLYISHPQTVTAIALSTPTFESQQTVEDLVVAEEETEAEPPITATVIALPETITYEANTLAVVNFQSKWGDKEANIASMTDYILQADSQGAQLIVFPEMAVTGYSNTSNSETWDYQMPIAYAETTTGPTATTFSALAQELDLWIIYGATETYSSAKAYNAAFVCSPDGTVETYRKVAPVEGDWCRAGTEPLVIDAGDLGRIGIGICYDTYAIPELATYYQGQNCDLYVNLTASSVNYSPDNNTAWVHYYTARLGSIAYQTRMTVASANMVDGCGGYFFPGGSVIFSQTQQPTIVTGEAGLVFNQSITQDLDTGLDTTVYAPWYTDISTVSNNPKYSYSSDKAPMVSLVNLQDGAIPAIVSAIHQAGSEDVDLLIFPSNSATSLVQDIPGTTTRTLSSYAKTYDMYILFGMTQQLPSGETCPAVAIVCPDGTILSHTQDSPTLLTTPWGSFGIALGDEFYDTPLLSRYYGAMGCKGILHLDDHAPSDWEIATVFESYSHRDGLAIATCNPEASGLLSIFQNQSGYQAIDWETGSAVAYTIPDAPMAWDVSDTGFSISYFNAKQYAQWFDPGTDA